MAIKVPVAELSGFTRGPGAGRRSSLNNLARPHALALSRHRGVADAAAAGGLVPPSTALSMVRNTSRA